MNHYRLTYTTETETNRSSQKSPSIESPGIASLLSPYGVVVVESATSANEALIDLTRQIDLPVVECVLRSGGYRVLGLNRVPDRERTAV